MVVVFAIETKNVMMTLRIFESQQVFSAILSCSYQTTIALQYMKLQMKAFHNIVGDARSSCPNLLYSFELHFFLLKRTCFALLFYNFLLVIDQVKKSTMHFLPKQLLNYQRQDNLIIYSIKEEFWRVYRTNVVLQAAVENFRHIKLIS